MLEITVLMKTSENFTDFTSLANIASYCVIVRNAGGRCRCTSPKNRWDGNLPAI